MDKPTIQISKEDARASEDDRFHRFALIPWWDQKKLARAKVLVIGAGALGNEMVKNLALLGVGHVLICDKDKIENSNLSRSILFRESDSGTYKAPAAAAMAREIYPDIDARHFTGDIVYELGLGVFRWADVVIAGLDNREARLAINRACWKVNRPWIDGAIEQIQGTARVFIPSHDAPCYECTMSARDWQLLQARRSCNLLSRQEMETGKTPTTPTISSIIAGVQCQEAVKIIHGLQTIGGRGWIFDGLSTEAYQVEFQRKSDCFSHDALDEIIPLNAGADGITAAACLARAREISGNPQAEIEICRDILEKFCCPKCGTEEMMHASLARVGADRAICPSCGDARQVMTFNRIRGSEAFMERALSDIGVPKLDILVVRTTDRSIGLELNGDAPSFLGESGEDGLQWE